MVSKRDVESNTCVLSVHTALMYMDKSCGTGLCTGVQVGQESCKHADVGEQGRQQGSCCTAVSAACVVCTHLSNLGYYLLSIWR